MADLSATNFSEVDSSNNFASPNGWTPGLMQPSQVEPTMQATTGAIKRSWNRVNGTVTGAGSLGSYTYSTGNVAYPAAYVQGEIYTFKAPFASIGNDTLSINGLPALPLYKFTSSGAVNIGANDLMGSKIYMAAYDSALNSGAGGFQVLNLPDSKSTPPAGDSSALIPTTQWVISLSLSSTLPGQAGANTKFVMSNGTSASWQYLISDPWVFYSMNAGLRAIAYSQ